jgi:transitional endoplasmic reticulum ATPase
VPILKKQNKKNLLIRATHYIGQLDAALLRLGRFDCIIPVGGLDAQGRRTIFEYYLSSVHPPMANLPDIGVARKI